MEPKNIHSSKVVAYLTNSHCPVCVCLTLNQILECWHLAAGLLEVSNDGGSSLSIPVDGNILIMVINPLERLLV